MTHVPTGLVACYAKTITSAKRAAAIFDKADVDWTSTDARALGAAKGAREAFQTARALRLTDY